MGSLEVVCGGGGMVERKGECCRCGSCCRNEAWRCEHLAEDMKTCLVHNSKPKQCVEFPQARDMVKLPKECTYYWEDMATGGIVKSGGEFVPHEGI